MIALAATPYVPLLGEAAPHMEKLAPTKMVANCLRQFDSVRNKELRERLSSRIKKRNEAGEGY